MRFVITALLVALVVAVAWRPRAAVAEIKLMPGARKKIATDIVVGTVSDLYEKKVATKRYGRGTVEKRFLVEMQVEKVEKGDLKKGRVLYVRAWKIHHIPGGSGKVVGFSGHKSIPSVGDKIRAYVVRGPYMGQTDNGYAAVYPTGFASINEE